MSTLIFDTHEFVTEMTNVGMPQPQAEVLAESNVELMENTLATKQDLKDLKAELTSKIDKAKIETIGIITAVMVGLAAIMAFFMAYLQAAK